MRDPLYRELADQIIDTEEKTPLTIARLIARHAKIELRLSEYVYSILIGQDLMADKRLFQSILLVDTVAVVSNPTVWSLYGAKLMETLQD